MIAVDDKADDVQDDQYDQNNDSCRVFAFPQGAAAQDGQKDRRETPYGRDKDPVGELDIRQTDQIGKEIFWGSRYEEEQ